MKWYKTIDFYISKKYLGTFFFAISLILGIAIIFDISENLDDFISKEIPTHVIIFDYYLNFIPYFGNLFAPLFTFIAVIYFTSKMAYNTEIIAILSSGVSYSRLLRPYMVSATVITLISFVLGNFIIPPANSEMIEFRDKYINKQVVGNLHNIHRQIEPGLYIYMQSFNSNDIGYRFTMERFKDAKLVEKLTAQNIRWDDKTEKWIINSYWKRIIHDDYEEIEKGYRLDTALNMTPKDFIVSKNEMETYKTPDLIREIDDLRMRGVRTVEWEIEQHRRFANPFSTFILTVIGVSLASRKIKGGLGFHLGLGLLLAFSYILFMQISTVFAINGNTPPIVAVWIPNLAYAVIAFFLYRWAAR